MKGKKRIWLFWLFTIVAVLILLTGIRKGNKEENEQENTPTSCIAEVVNRRFAKALEGIGQTVKGLQAMEGEVSALITKIKWKALDESLKNPDTGETENQYCRADGEGVFFVRMDETLIDKLFGEELAEYFIHALEEEKLLESLKKIEAAHELLSEEEKQAFDLPEEKKGAGLALYYEEIENDDWYRVSLTEEGDDIIVEHVEEDGHIVNYFFFNIMGKHVYSDLPLWAGGQKGSHPYFISWGEENYLAIPYWDREGDNIIGVTIHKYLDNYSACVLAIGKNSDSSISVTLQDYEIVPYNYRFLSLGATRWPVVVYY